MDLATIRRLVIIAMFSDDVLFRRLALKGGNAISLVYKYGGRGSLDVDFSLDGEFEDTEDASRRIIGALTDRFDAAGFVVFDYEFGPRPAIPAAANPRWGGYRIKFKIIERDNHRRFVGDQEAVRRHATVIGPAQQRVFTIDISKWEFCDGKTESQLKEFTILRLHSANARYRKNPSDLPVNDRIPNSCGEDSEGPRLLMTYMVSHPFARERMGHPQLE